MAYSAKVMEHFSNPHNVGEIKDADGVGEVGNPKCGDIMRMYIKVDNDVITDVKFMTFGCGAAIATSSMATDLVKGKTIPEALKLTNKAVMEALDGLPAIKVHCSVLAEQAIKAAVSDYYRRRGIDPAQIPAVLVHNHGPFTWGKDADEAVYHAVVLEEVAFMNFHAKLLNPAAGPMPQVLLDKHYLRKHGANAYYGQG